MKWKEWRRESSYSNSHFQSGLDGAHGEVYTKFGRHCGWANCRPGAREEKDWRPPPSYASNVTKKLKISFESDFPVLCLKNLITNFVWFVEARSTEAHEWVWNRARVVRDGYYLFFRHCRVYANERWEYTVPGNKLTLPLLWQDGNYNRAKEVGMKMRKFRLEILCTRHSKAYVWIWKGGESCFHLVKTRLERSKWTSKV